MEDWKSAHLKWISDNPKFVSKTYSGDVSYLEIMKQVYENEKASQEYAKLTFAQDLQWKKKSNKLLLELERELSTTTSHFITIGFNHQTWNIEQCVFVIDNIMAFDWISSGRAVFELHRENGEHPHCHFLIESVLPKSKILEKIWACKGIKKCVLKKSFIDYKSENQNHRNYIHGKKTEDKMKYVELDREWRSNNNIKQYWQK